MKRAKLPIRSKPGVYCILNKLNGKRYVGRSKDIYHRIYKQHQDMLKNGDHHSIKLQNAWNKYGKKNFQFFAVEYCTEELLEERELYWQNFFDSLNNGYDMIEGGRVSPSSNPIIAKKISESQLALGENHWNKSIEARKKLSEAQNKYYKDHPEAGKKNSERMKKYYKDNPEARKKMSEAHKKYYKDNPTSYEFRKKLSEIRKKHCATPGFIPPMKDPKVVAKARKTRRASAIKKKERKAMRMKRMPSIISFLIQEENYIEFIKQRKEVPSTVIELAMKRRVKE